MTFRTNDFSDTFQREGEHLNVAALAALRNGSFDRHNDCWIDGKGEFIHIRNVSKPISINRLGLFGAATDALTIWERHHNSAAAFAHHYADDPTECGFGDAA
jgi:hypothetical protein